MSSSRAVLGEYIPFGRESTAGVLDKLSTGLKVLDMSTHPVERALILAAEIGGIGSTTSRQKKCDFSDYHELYLVDPVLWPKSSSTKAPISSGAASAGAGGPSTAPKSSR